MRGIESCFGVMSNLRNSNGFYLSILLILLLLEGCARPPQESLLSRGAICDDIGRPGFERDICALNITSYSTYHETTRVFIVSEYSIQEIESLGGGFGIYEMLASPARRYLAIVENGGEGHPYLGLCSLEAAEKWDDKPCFAGFDPYPGGVYDLKWQGEVLTFSSDGIEPLLLESETEYYQRYTLDAKSGKLNKKGEPLPVE